MSTDYVKEKLRKSGRNWKELEPPHDREVQLLCEKCGKSMGIEDATRVDLRTLMYCDNCAKPFVRQVPYKITDNIEVTFDNGIIVTVKYTGGYYNELSVDKICYYNKKGRFIKIKGKMYYLNKTATVLSNTINYIHNQYNNNFNTLQFAKI